MYETKEEVESWLILMGIDNYVINEDLTVDVNGDVNLSKKKLKEIPIRFNKVNGNFYCYNNALTNLKGFPGVIKGDFSCSNNKLTSLEGCPEIIEGDFNCSDNRLTSLEGCSKEVTGDFNCDNNELTSLEGCPEVINGNFDCDNNGLTNFKYFPKEINGRFVYFLQNKINEEELFNFNCSIENVKEICSDFNEDGNKEKFLEKVNFYKSKRENELLKEVSVNSNNIKLNKKL